MSSQRRRRRLEIEDIGDVTVVRWDEQPQWTVLGEQLFSLVDDSGRRKILLNFGHTDSLSSVVLGKLVTLSKKLRAVNGLLAVCDVSAHVQEVFELTKVSQFFGTYAAEQEALQALEKAVLRPPSSEPQAAIAAPSGTLSPERSSSG